MAKITSYKAHESGVALGGIGTGSVELRPDGEFHDWQISNQPRWAQVSGGDPVDDGDRHTGALSFWVRTQSGDGRPLVRKLGMRTSRDDFTYSMFAWNKAVERIDFDGRFPVCDLTYGDSDLPCKVSLRAVAPFVPHEPELSATPGIYLNFTLTNPTDAPLHVSLLGALIPSFANPGGCVNELSREQGSASIFSHPTPFRAWRDPYEKLPETGSVCLSAESDGRITYITGDYFRFLRECVFHTGFGVSQESFLFGFRENGCLPDTDGDTCPLPIPEDLSELTDDAISTRVTELMRYASTRSLMERIRHLNPTFPADRDEQEQFLECIRIQQRTVGRDFGACALCSDLTLAAGESREVRFVLSWYFGNHFSATGSRLGHFYETRFKDAREANRFLCDKREAIADRAAAFAELLYRTDLPEDYPDGWSIHLSTLVKNSWWIKDGKFGLWEGLGFCGFHTTDITYHDSFGLIALFPTLQKRQMQMGAAFQREDGRVHHFFTPDLEHVDEGFERVDMNPQFVLMVCRDYLYTGDRDYLASLWSNVQRAMDASALLDSDGDGLPDTDTRRNTYDAWNFSGSPTYICVLWLASLKAAALLAREMHDPARAEHWEVLLDKGKAALEKKLWNGSYYDLWRDEKQTDSCLMTDQLDGEWFLRMMGLEGNLPDSRVRDVLRTIFAANFDPEDGLINATCPPDRPTTRFTYKNCQAEAIWTGIGYAFSALAQSVGLTDIAERELRSIHETQRRFGWIWNHWECGPHYTRPLSSWSTLNAELGLRVDAAERTVTLRPVRKNVTLPLVLTDVLATLTFDGDTCTATCIEGDLSTWKVCLPYGMTLKI